MLGTQDGMLAWIQWQGNVIRQGIEMAKQLAEMADTSK
jgi:hypothetical protein